MIRIIVSKKPCKLMAKANSFSSISPLLINRDQKVEKKIHVDWLSLKASWQELWNDEKLKIDGDDKGIQKSHKQVYRYTIQLQLGPKAMVIRTMIWYSNFRGNNSDTWFSIIKLELQS